MNMMKHPQSTMRNFLSSMVILLMITSCSTVTPKTTSTDEWQSLLDTNLTQWETWLGVPHTSVKGLSKDIHTADNLNIHGDPALAIGLNNDVKNIFTIIEEEGQQVLKISGEIYGGLTSTANFENFHLTLEVKWGDKKWAPRLNVKRDSGVLFHCQGEHGAFWRTWKACQEMQIQESDLGDYIPLAGPSAVITTNAKRGEKKQHQYAPGGQFKELVTGYTQASSEPDMPHGKWNRVDIYAFGDNAIFVVNGVKVMEIEQSKDKQGMPLTSGQLQIQSEGAEVYYRDMKIRKINQIPEV